MIKSSMASRAIAKKPINYVLGYVIGVEWGSNFEDLLHKGGICSMWHDRPDYHPTIYKTKEDATKYAQKLKTIQSNEFLTTSKYFVRGYIYSTPNPENAVGLELAENVNDLAKIYI